jgi:preprotein translocase subunit SecD
MWKNLLILGIILIAFLYAAPNLYGDDPGIQIMGSNATIPVDENTENQIKNTLDTAGIQYKSMELQDRLLLVRFLSNDVQLKAREQIQDTLGKNYLVALNLAPRTPHWLKSIGAMPMKLGLDLRGGIHLLIEVDVDSVLKQRIDSDLNNISQTLRTERVRYAGVTRDANNGITLQFRSADALNDAYSLLVQRFNEFSWTKGDLTLQGVWSPNALQFARQEIMDQTMNTLRHRVNELGVSEAIVQQQGATRIAVDLPGIVDTAQAKNILGKTAALEFHMVDIENDARNAVNGLTPADTKLYYDEDNQPILLKNQVILRGSSIISATSGMGEDGRPSVSVRLGGGGDSLFSRTTAESVGKPMAVVYIDIRAETKNEQGVKTISYQTDKKIISVARINSALGNAFQITGLKSQEEARTLALLLRAGALPAPTAVIEEREIGPTLGQQNIDRGIMSVVVGFLLVVVFMALYYRVFGLVANLALGMNLVLIVAILSLLGGTLTLPGIAGIVLTVGMAADANVLIFERIREELRNGSSVQASIYAGYDRAFVTIVDANLTTLIVTIVLFSLGSGAVKSFAVTVTIGLLTSMFTAITGTRALVNWMYGGRQVKRVSIGI